MKLWLLMPVEADPVKWPSCFDECSGGIVQAKTEQRARELMEEDSNHGETRICPWLDLEKTVCLELGYVGKPEKNTRDNRWLELLLELG